MTSSLRVILFNQDESCAAALRRELLRCEGLQIVAELDEPTMLPQAVGQFPAELLVVHLDPQPTEMLDIAARIAASRPALAVFAVSESLESGLILRALRAGLREYLTKPLDPETLAAAVGRVAEARPARTKQGRIVSVCGTTGGAGATTIAVNLACELAELTGEPVGMLDLDFRFGQLTTLLDLQPSFSIADLCDSHEQIDQQMIERAMVKHGTHVHVLARPHHLAQAEQITAATCAGVLAGMQELYDHIVIDGPHRFDGSGKVVLDMADVSLMVVLLLVTSVRNADRLLGELAGEGYNLDRIRLIANRLGRESGYLEPQHVEATLNRKVFATICDDWRTVSASINSGQPLITAAPKSRVRQAIRELARQLLASETDADAADEARAPVRLFQRIFKTESA